MLRRRGLKERDVQILEELSISIDNELVSGYCSEDPAFIIEVIKVLHAYEQMRFDSFSVAVVEPVLEVLLSGFGGEFEHDSSFVLRICASLGRLPIGSSVIRQVADKLLEMSTATACLCDLAWSLATIDELTVSDFERTVALCMKDKSYGYSREFQKLSQAFHGLQPLPPDATEL